MVDNQKQLVALLDAAEAQLSKTAFLAGETYSPADVMLTCAVFLVEQAKQEKVELASRPYGGKASSRGPCLKWCLGLPQVPITLLTLVLSAVAKSTFNKLLHRY